MRFELHCHSTCSDGELAPQLVAERAQASGAQVFCLTDHDTTAGHGATLSASTDMVVMRGVELSCHYKDRSVHVLVYDAESSSRWDDLESVLTSVANAREKRVVAMAKRLAERDIHIDVESIIARAGEKTVGRPDVARALVAVGAVRSAREAFDRYLYDGGPIDMPTSRLSLEEGVALAAGAGARLSLAHPHVHGPKRTAEILKLGKPLGMSGLEVFYGLYNAGQRRGWQQLADEFSMVATGGSDFHADAGGREQVLGVELDAAVSKPLCDWLGIDFVPESPA